MREPLLLSPSNNRGVLLREKGEEGETLLLSYNDRQHVEVCCKAPDNLDKTMYSSFS
jgi:hypothetical protein